MTRRSHSTTLRLGVLMVTLSLAPTFSGTPSTRAQETAAKFVPREEMIDAIMPYGGSGGCETLREVFGEVHVSACKDALRDTGVAEHAFVRVILSRLSDTALIELCRKNKITDCEEPREVSSGRAILTLQSEVRLRVTPHRPAWSRDNRFLLLDNLPKFGELEVRLLDLGQGRLRDTFFTGGQLNASAWSYDGKYVALSDGRAIRLYSSVSFEEKAIFAASKECSRLGKPALLTSPVGSMAFSTDSEALWVTCGRFKDRPMKAIKLSVPGLKIQDEFSPVLSVPDWQASVWENNAILRYGDNLILVGSFRVERPDALRGIAAVQTFSLPSKQSLHPPIFAPTWKLLSGIRLTDDLSGIYVRDELWSTKSSEIVARDINSSGRYLGAPNRLPRLAMHIESRADKNALRGDLIVLDSTSGATIQEIGPIPTARMVLVSPDSSMVAVFGRYGIRLYRVNP